MKPENDYGTIQCSHASNILAQVFGAEWDTLLGLARYLVVVDYLDAANEDGTGAREYARRIGAGNLASYGRTMVARANSARPWSAQ
jgi:hypothetical protein